jgi:hypothetical protein
LYKPVSVRIFGPVHSSILLASYMLADKHGLIFGTYSYYRKP